MIPLNDGVSTCPAVCSSFVIISTNPVSSTTASVLLGRVSSGRVRTYNVRACWVGAPNNCKTKQCTSVNCSPIGPLTPGRRYVVSAIANMTTGQQVKAAATLTLAMPVASAPVLLLAELAGRRTGTATALPPATGACPGYFWVFAPASGGAGVNVTTTTLTVTTAGAALAPGGVYDVRVACVRSGTAAIRSLLQELGPFSNALRIVMPAAGAPFLTASATGSTTASAIIQPPAGTGEDLLAPSRLWFALYWPPRPPHMTLLNNPKLPVHVRTLCYPFAFRLDELPADHLPSWRTCSQLPQCAMHHSCDRLRSDQPCRRHSIHCYSRGHPVRRRQKPNKQHRDVDHLPHWAACPMRYNLHRCQHLLQDQPFCGTELRCPSRVQC